MNNRLILMWLLYVLFSFFYGIIRGFTQFCIVNNTLMYLQKITFYYFIINNILMRIFFNFSYFLECPPRILGGFTWRFSRILLILRWWNGSKTTSTRACSLISPEVMVKYHFFMLYGLTINLMFFLSPLWMCFGKIQWTER